MYSRGSELSIVNGTRTDLPATPKVGASRLSSSTSGSRVAAAHRHGEHRHALHPQPRGGLHRRLALVPVAVGGQHDAAQVRRSSRAPGPAARTGRCRVPACGGGERLDDDVHPLPQLVPRRRVGQRRDRLACGSSAAASAGRRATTSRVSMLGEASQSTAIAGFSSGRYSSIHSGWLSSTAHDRDERRAAAARAAPSTADSRSAARRRSRSPAVTSTTTTDDGDRPGRPEERERSGDAHDAAPSRRRSRLGQAEAGLDHHRHHHGDQEQPPDLLDQRAEAAGLVVDAGEVEAAEQAGHAAIGQHRRPSPRRPVGSRPAAGRPTRRRRGGTGTRSRSPRRPPASRFQVVGSSPGGSPADELPRAPQRPRPRRPAPAAPGRRGRRRRSPATSRRRPAWSRRSRRRRGSSRPGPAAARRPSSVASGVNSPARPQYRRTWSCPTGSGAPLWVWASRS